MRSAVAANRLLWAGEAPPRYVLPAVKPAPRIWASQRAPPPNLPSAFLTASANTLSLPETTDFAAATVPWASAPYAGLDLLKHRHQTADDLTLGRRLHGDREVVDVDVEAYPRPPQRLVLEYATHPFH